MDVVDRIGPLARHVADVTAITLVEAGHTQRHARAQRHVDEGVDAAAVRIRALGEAGARNVDAALEAVGVRLVGDEPQGARQRTGAIKRALRAREGLDALHVIDVQVNRAGDGRQRNFVDIEGAGRLRAGMAAVALAARGDAAEIDLRLARPGEGLIADRGQQAGVIVKAGNMVVVQLLGRKRLDADRHILQGFGPLLGGDDDLVALCRWCPGLCPRLRQRGRAGQNCARQQREGRIATRDWRKT